MMHTFNHHVIVRDFMESLPRLDWVLDLGGGIGDIQANLPGWNKMNIDLWQPELDLCSQNHPEIFTLQYDIRRLRELLPPNSVDMIMCWDVLEHMSREESLQLMEDAEVVAKYGVTWFGPIEKTPTKFGGHVLGVYEKNPLMDHVQCLDMEMFLDRGYEVVLMPGYWDVAPKLDAVAILALKRLPYENPAA